MSMLPPVEYQQQIAKLRMAELARSSQQALRSKQRVRHTLAGGLRKLADWIEPALSMRIPAQRHPA
ncbi:hypothetical protein [Flindersiella endophytica]